MAKECSQKINLNGLTSTKTKFLYPEDRSCLKLHKLFPSFNALDKRKDLIDALPVLTKIAALCKEDCHLSGNKKKHKLLPLE